MKTKTKLTATLDTWSKAIGVDERTLKIRLTKAGVKVEPFGQLTARQIIKAMTGEKDAAVIRKLTAEAEKTEMQNKIRDGQLIELATADRELWFNLYLPFKQALEAMPNEVSPLCVSPDAARAALTQHLENIKSKILLKHQQEKP